MQSIPTNSNSPDVLMRQLNSLLNALQIPIPLQSPRELTPSLMIHILNSMLSVRLDAAVKTDSHEKMNLSRTKLFLGVLETDVLKTDVGLSNIDPRLLASGALEECTYIATLLCWIGRRQNYIVTDDPFQMDNEAPYAPDPSSPSASITTKETFIASNFSPLGTTESNTSIDSMIPSSPTRISTPRPRCIHQVPSPTLRSPQRHTNSVQRLFASPSSSPSKVRRSGYISPVDHELEVSLYENSRIMASTDMSNADSTHHHVRTPIVEFESKLTLFVKSESSFSLAALRESTARMLMLSQERARLMMEVARLETQHLRRPS
ncbi:hypothetical protein H0H93_007585 [Arthromyces matolae]|nr:hypothetical protein H0H93_007585 [Arthromyces matolae]